MPDKMIAISPEAAEMVKDIQETLEYPVTIKAVIHKAIVELHAKVLP